MYSEKAVTVSVWLVHATLAAVTVHVGCLIRFRTPVT